MKNDSYEEYEENDFDPPRKTDAEKKKGRKKRILLIACVAIVLAIALGVTFIILSRPKNSVRIAAYSTAKEVLSHDMAQLVSKAVRGGSIEVEAKNQHAKAAGKLYIDLEHLRAQAEDITLSTADRALITANAAVGLDEIWVELNGKGYGFASGNTEDAFLNSQFFKDLFDPKSEIYHQMQALCMLYDDAESEQLIKRLGEEISAYQKEELKLYLEYAEISEEKGKVRLVDGREKCRIITIVIEDEVMEEVRDEMLDYLEESDSLHELMYDYEEIFVGLLGGDPDHGDLDDLFEKYLNERRKDNGVVRDATHSYTVELILSPILPRLLGFSVEEKWNGKEWEIFSIKGDKHGLTESEKLSFSVWEQECSFEVKENSSKAYKAKLVIDGVSISYERDKKDGDFKLNVQDLCKIIGTLHYDEDELILKVNSISVVDGYLKEILESLHGSVTILAEDEIPDQSTFYTNLLSMNEQEWEGLYDDLWGIVEKIN